METECKKDGNKTQANLLYTIIVAVLDTAFLIHLILSANRLVIRRQTKTRPIMRDGWTSSTLEGLLIKFKGLFYIIFT